MFAQSAPALILLIFFFMCNVAMLNLLIAIMASTYEGEPHENLSVS